MRQIPSDKYTIAWFKLADFVSRGEKERALGLYRLLTHSIGDEALSHQLAGDLFLSFHDEQALQKYYQAAELYKKQHRYLQAVAVYEHIAFLQPNNHEAFIYLLHSYLKLKNQDKVYDITQKLGVLITVSSDSNQILRSVHEASLTQAEKASIYQQLTLVLVQQCPLPYQTALEWGQKAVDALVLCDNQEITPFLHAIKLIHEALHQELCAFLEK
jgi:tetratricopeptide (TPR) repeat protein